MKEKILIAGVLITLLLGGCFERERIKIIGEGPKPAQEGPVYVGWGWSTEDDTITAVNEAVQKAKEKLGEKTVDYVLLFSTVGYNHEVVLEEVNKAFPDAQIYGGTSCAAVLTMEGYHRGKNASLALFVVSSQNISFGVGGADIGESAREAGGKAIREAIKNAGREGETPKLVLITAAPGKEEEILLGIEDVIGKNIPIIGGSSADNTIEEYWKQFANDKVYSNGVALTAIFTDLKIGFAYEAGYIVEEEEGNITSASGRIIYEIDGKPAAEVYNNWTGGIIEEKLETGGTVLSETTFWPLAKVLTGEDESIHYLSIHPLSVNLPEKSLTVFANVEEGERIILMHGDWGTLLSWAQTTPAKALSNGDIAKGEGAFGLYTYCAGTMLAIPEERRTWMPLLVKEEIGIPFIGTFTFGEQGYIPGVGNRHGNLVNSMIIFGQDEES